MLDIVIRDGLIYDGTGNPPFHGDVGLRAGRIAAVGRVRLPARKTIDARRLAVCPGFVDVHSHADLARNPIAHNLIRQGITTVVSGNCGDSPLPIRKALAAVAAARPAIHFATFVGHNDVRKQVMGMAACRPTPREQRKMRRLVEGAMADGAVGFSTGLIYTPSVYATTNELVDLAAVAGANGGIYATHMRDAGPNVLEAIAEAGEIGRRAKLPVLASHLKVCHRKGVSQAARRTRVQEGLDVIRRYRNRGVDMLADVYPYTASHTSLFAATIPPWVAEGGRLPENLRDPAVRRKIRKDVADLIAWRQGAESFVISSCPGRPSLVGKTLAQIARRRKTNAANAAMDLVAEYNPDIISHAMHPEDVATIIASPHTMIASDSSVDTKELPMVHPRYYGAFPRVIAQYVREAPTLTMEQAIRKMTSLPARAVGLSDCGLLAKGMQADVIIFDPRRFADRATFETPRRHPVGLKHVLIRGHIALTAQKLSPQRHGRVVRPGKDNAT